MRVLYSIIIPHRSILNLLNRLIDSIPCRTDIEIIIVDNSITPISKEDISYDGKNVKLIYSDPNKGAGHARNIGINTAVGKWLIFADADDYFNYCINLILDEYQDDEADLVFFNANSVDTEYYTPCSRSNHLAKYINLYRYNPEKSVNLLRYKFGEPWCKLIKKSIVDINLIAFDEIPIHNDTKFSYLAGYYSKYIKVDKRALYCVTDRLGSVSKDDRNLQKKLCRISVFIQSSQFFKKNKIQIAEDRHLLEAIKIFLFDYKNFKEVKHTFKDLNYSIIDIIKQLLYAFKFRLSNRVAFMLKK